MGLLQQMWRGVFGESTPATVQDGSGAGHGNAANVEAAGIPAQGQAQPRGSATMEEEGWGEWLARSAIGIGGGAIAGGLLAGPWGALGGAIMGGLESTRLSEMWGDPQVLETDGNDSTVYDITGGPGTDMTDQGSGDYGSLLMDQANQGVFPTLIPETHRELMNTSIPQEARDSLDALGQEVHNPFETGSGAYNIDEYSMIMEELPEGFDSPEQFMAQFLRSPNDMAGHQDHPWQVDFDTYNEFYPKEAGSQNDWSGGPGEAPGVGDWYNIHIPGNYGDVMLVDEQNEDGRTAATVQTMTDDGFGPTTDHPVSGRRQFGMEQLEEGGYRFYTRGFDRQTNPMMDPQVSNMAQHADWSVLMQSMASQYGGAPERTDADGNPMWGWCRQVSGEGLATSME